MIIFNKFYLNFDVKPPNVLIHKNDDGICNTIMIDIDGAYLLERVRNGDKQIFFDYSDSTSPVDLSFYYINYNPVVDDYIRFNKKFNKTLTEKSNYSGIISIILFILSNGTLNLYQLILQVTCAVADYVAQDLYIDFNKFVDEIYKDFFKHMSNVVNYKSKDYKSTKAHKYKSSYTAQYSDSVAKRLFIYSMFVDDINEICSINDDDGIITMNFSLKLSDEITITKHINCSGYFADKKQAQKFKANVKEYYHDQIKKYIKLYIFKDDDKAEKLDNLILNMSRVISSHRMDLSEVIRIITELNSSDQVVKPSTIPVIPSDMKPTGVSTDNPVVIQEKKKIFGTDNLSTTQQKLRIFGTNNKE